MNREQKAAAVEEISSALTDAEAIFAVDYRGISVPQAAELRARLADADATFRIVKNRLAKRAAESAGTEEIADLFEGPIALTFVKGDPVGAAKTLATFGREHKLLEFKGGLMEGERLEPDQFSAIARLPGLEVLRGQLVGVAASPITGLARGLGAMLSGLTVALGQIQEKGLVGSEAEDEAAEVTEKPEGDADPAEPDAKASEEQDHADAGAEQRGEAPTARRDAGPGSLESERAQAEDSAGNDDDSNEEE
jgi:large subunit ribosomal protein L10